ncbi:superoxide dismutase [Caulobacter sp. D4A]|jgi:Cu-Zn family superoxide dismutase|uniref:superoxide dismutase[Cu-Zn] n=1 Tax=unclassified Caulobacter TaxID=2648921 RepID=UPI000D73E511|nr:MULTISPECIES: superoxide dismutase family protein [unclassified Caulobacter]PXA82788.1 superoxide dismutase [Caulobacter sp. D4A]PXA93818.1 superoxide dismutase [Caulobacter sp. D5]
MRLTALFLAAGLVAATAASAAEAPATATADIKGADGKSIGTATLTEGPRGVLLRIEAKGLTPGWHGLHFHEKGDCGTPDFKSAGAHVHAATTVVHGLLNAEGNDNGDLPNLHAGADGVASAEFFSQLVSLKGGRGRPALLDADGSAIVIHASPDDYTSQPIGGAGARSACGVVK